MKEIIITMENKNIGVKTSTNGDAIKNEKIENAAPKKSFWERQSETVQIIVTATIGFGVLLGVGLLGGAFATSIKESATRKTMDSDGYKAHDKLLSDETVARIQRGLFDEPKTLEEAAARMLEKNSRQQIIVIDPYEMSQMSA